MSNVDENTATLSGKTYVAKEQLGCGGCAFDSDIGLCGDSANCSSAHRLDKRSIIWVEAGQPFKALSKIEPDPNAKPAAPTVYVIGSLRNDNVPKVAAELRTAGHDVFDDWYAAGPEADDYWQKYERAKHSSYPEALAGYAAQNVFKFDKHHLDRCEAVVLVLPAGKSGHLELGYCAGKGKRTYILLEQEEPERFDVMYNFATKVVRNMEELIHELRQ